MKINGPMKSVILIATASVFLSTANFAHAGKLEDAVYKAVVLEKQTKKVKASGGHHFNIKPVKAVRTAEGYLVKGQLSHHLSYRKDDQYFYTMRVSRTGTIIDLKEKVNRGGITSVLKQLPVGDLIKAKTKSKVKVDKKTSKEAIVAAGKWLGRHIDGKWELSARKVAVTVGLQVAQYYNLRPIY